MENKFKIDKSHKFAREVFIGVCIIKTRKFDVLVYFKDNCQLSE